MDGVRIAAGWVRELQGRWLGPIGVDWRSADGLQSPHRAPMALCGSCDARDGERILSRELSRTGVARVCGEVGSVAGWQSGGEWNGSQSGHGASELGFPRPMLGKMQGKAARRAGDPSHQSEEPPPEGFGRDSPDQTNFPGNSSFWDTVKYNPAFQGRPMRPNSLKFPVFI